MAYAAAISLKQTIQRLLKSSHISIDSSSREILEFAYEEVESLQEVLERFDESGNSSESERMKALEGQMREAVCKMEDVLESHVSTQFLSQCNSLGEEKRPLFFSLDLQELRQDIDCLKKKEEECIKELDNPPPEKEDDGFDFGQNETEMVGLSDQFREIRDKLVDWPTTLTASIVGMAGIGKTTLAKKLFVDPSTLRNFECRIFVKVGPKSQLNEILQAILAQVNSSSNKMLMEGDENSDDYLCKSLTGRRFFIVLDDVWSADFWDDFRRRLPEEDNGSLVLVTTRLEQVATSISAFKTYKIRFLDKEESWHLLRERVFREELCPRQLEKAGKKIAENCDGLPLMIITIANLLSKVEKTSEYWNKAATDKENPMFMDAYDQILKVLCPSYNYLPQPLKACFLYMGAFPQNYEVRRSKLISLWDAEGFLDKNFRLFVWLYFEELVSSNVVVVRQRSRYHGRVKACSLHSVFWHLCRKEAGNNKFLHMLNSYVDGAAEGMENQRRLSIYNNVLFSIKDVYDSIISISTARSLLCTGTYHQYQVPICFCLRLLRVFDALTIRFYEFPMEVLKLIQLRYLALTCNGNIPPSISILWNLQYLIVYRHSSIKFPVAESYLPVEIWDLQELKYLEIMGRNLPDPCGATLPNLLTLLDVGAYSCTKSVFESIPILEKLRVQIELALNVVEPLSCLDHISYLCRLRSLEYFVVNPDFMSEIVAPPPSLSVFTSGVKKLTLSGFGYPWKDISKIAALPSLQVLKLKCYAFRGEKWEVEEKGFLSLEYLLIEDTDLVLWIARVKTFPRLSYLSMESCYKLQEIPNISSLRHIRLVDCNSTAVACAKQMVDQCYRFYANYSWDDGNLKS